jgi:hypothetical protein
LWNVSLVSARCPDEANLIALNLMHGMSPMPKQSRKPGTTMQGNLPTIVARSHVLYGKCRWIDRCNANLQTDVDEQPLYGIA